MKKVLMVAYHFPPIGVSSGVHRTLKFAQYLRDYGWAPAVLTVTPNAYEQVNEKHSEAILAGIEVERAPAFDAVKAFSLFGRYPGLLALPDRWWPWIFSGVARGRRLISRFNPDVIFSTYPIATAHLIGYFLHKISGKPWIADFRDSMTEEHYPADKTKRWVYRRIEELAVRNASRVIFTTPSTLRMYRERYPEFDDRHWSVIENGYDEGDFSEVCSAIAPAGKDNQRLKLVHSGLLYPVERDPTCFFEALAQLKKEGVASKENLHVVLRASGNEEQYHNLLVQHEIDDIVELAPSMPYRDALREMTEADGLLVFQAKNCNHQIPAKLYECLRARRPLFVMTDAAGDTAATVRSAKAGMLVQLDSTADIKQGLVEFTKSVRSGNAQVASDETIKSYSRKGRTESLAGLLNETLR